MRLALRRDVSCQTCIAAQREFQGTGAKNGEKGWRNRPFCVGFHGKCLNYALHISRPFIKWRRVTRRL